MKDATCVTIPPEAVVAAVLRKMAEGKTVKQIREMGLLGEDDNPFLWKQVDPDLARQIEQVQRASADLLADQVQDVAVDMGLAPADKKVMIEAKKWLAEKYNPERFGAKYVPPKNVDEMDHMTIEQIEKRKEELMAQVREALEKQEMARRASMLDGAGNE